MIGLLVCGDNHFILQGPRPTREEAQALAAHFHLIRIGSETPVELRRWTIVTRAYREQLEWAAIAPGEAPHTGAVQRLLEELAARGVPVQRP